MLSSWPSPFVTASIHTGLLWLVDGPSFSIQAFMVMFLYSLKHSGTTSLNEHMALPISSLGNVLLWNLWKRQHDWLFLGAAARRHQRSRANLHCTRATASLKPKSKADTREKGIWPTQEFMCICTMLFESWYKVYKLKACYPLGTSLGMLLWLDPGIWESHERKRCHYSWATTNLSINQRL